MARAMEMMSSSVRFPLCLMFFSCGRGAVGRRELRIRRTESGSSPGVAIYTCLIYRYRRKMAGRAFLRSRGGSLRARMIMEEAEGTSETAAWGKRGVETKKKRRSDGAKSLP